MGFELPPGQDPAIVNGEIEQRVRSGLELEAPRAAPVAHDRVLDRGQLGANQFDVRLGVIRPVNDVAVLAEDYGAIVGPPVGEARSRNPLGQVGGQD